MIILYNYAQKSISLVHYKQNRIINKTDKALYLMGCGSAQPVQEGDLIIHRKPTVWLIGGGPGCNKGQICERLENQYKFKYLSSYDMVEFEQERGGPDAEIIKKAFKEGTYLTSELKVRLIKKAIASVGIRKFIIDGFPDNVEDIHQFSKELTAREIDFRGYIHITISPEKMRDSGRKAHESSKGSQEQIQKKITQTINSYLEESRRICEVYKTQNKYIGVDGEKGVDPALSKIIDYLEGQKVESPKPIKVFFAHFDDPVLEIEFTDDLVRKFGLYYYTPAGLINEARHKSNSPFSAQLAKLEIQNKEVPPDIVLKLVRKKFEKHDYNGKFLISGYPRNISDAEEWDKYFGWETDILGYLTFEINDEQEKNLFIQKHKKTNPTSKPNELQLLYSIYHEQQQKISTYYQQKDKLLKLSSQNHKQLLEEIHEFFKQKQFSFRKPLFQSKMMFVSTLCGPSLVLSRNRKGVVDMEELYRREISNNSLYAELIESFYKINKPVPGLVATKILLSHLVSSRIQGGIVVMGFPNSAEQLQSWEEEVGESVELTGIVFYMFDEKYMEHQIRQKISENKITSVEKDALAYTKRFSQELSWKITNSDWKYLELKTIDSGKEQKFSEFEKSVNFF